MRTGLDPYLWFETGVYSQELKARAVAYSRMAIAIRNNIEQVSIDKARRDAGSRKK